VRGQGGKEEQKRPTQLNPGRKSGTVFLDNRRKCAKTRFGYRDPFGIPILSKVKRKKAKKDQQ
jgi:hypothetical protein